MYGSTLGCSLPLHAVFDMLEQVAFAKWAGISQARTHESSKRVRPQLVRPGPSLPKLLWACTASCGSCVAALVVCSCLLLSLMTESVCERQGTGAECEGVWRRNL